jgi:hypothetical protein
MTLQAQLEAMMLHTPKGGRFLFIQGCTVALLVRSMLFRRVSMSWRAVFLDVCRAMSGRNVMAV